MKITFRRFSPLVAAFLATTALAHAHPGHDGDELTWDFGHLASHPLATLTCVIVLIAGAWGAARLVSAGAAYVQEVIRRRSDRRD